ncbi:MAG: vanadium-dependent haloperoxidase [Dyadobacter sp.]|uniref:vanadium-dependent haloperoxidase n=1 Tax=Dyadobacter sp. TaxID=1914288 RepID=UPI003265D600
MKHSQQIHRTIRISIWLIACPIIALAINHRSITTQKPAAGLSGDVVTSWLTLQLKITKTTPAPPPVTVRRCGYTGVALYESVAPGLVGYQSIAPQLNGLTNLPAVKPGVSYYWPASANAAMATITRAFFPMTSPANKASIDSLEAANVVIFQKDSPADALTRSAEFGKSIASAVFEWSKTDGSDNKTPFDIPQRAGAWLPTPPSLMAAALPNWGKNRMILIGSDSDADLAVPVPYSTDPNSEYYAQVKEVYDISQSLTPEQKAIAFFWADDPDGKSFGGAHWLSILNQILINKKVDLELAAVAYAKLGIACSESAVSIFKGKYRYNGLRPITYIRTVMNKPEWNTLIVTPPHPEYPSGHAIVSAAAAQTLTLLFGPNFAFTDNSYNLVGFKPRSYKSFEEAAIEAGNSRVYGGIHYRKTCDAGQEQGKKIARNIDEKLKFKQS